YSQAGLRSRGSRMTRSGSRSTMTGWWGCTAWRSIRSAGGPGAGRRSSGRSLPAPTPRWRISRSRSPTRRRSGCTRGSGSPRRTGTATAWRLAKVQTVAEVDDRAQIEPPVLAEVRLRINGEDHALTIDTRTSLLDLLREHLDLTGAKKGCDHGQ